MPTVTRRRKAKHIVAHDLVRSIWRLRGKCEDCGRTKEQGWQMQGAHVYGTGAHPRIGSDLRNGMCLCASCHRKWTNNPEWKEFVLGSRVGKYYFTLLRLTQNHQKVDWLDRVDFLREIKRAIIVGEMTIEEACEYETDY